MIRYLLTSIVDICNWQLKSPFDNYDYYHLPHPLTMKALSNLTQLNLSILLTIHKAFYLGH